MKFLFYFRTAKRKHDKMAFLMSIQKSKYVSMFVLGADRRARDALKSKFTGVGT